MSLPGSFLPAQKKHLNYCVLRFGMPLLGSFQEPMVPIKAYDFLSEINPSQSVSILKHTEDDEIYVGWTELGYAIRLAEFAIVE